MKVLITGGAGYIGSTVCSALKDRGHTPIILDSLVTGRREFANRHAFYKGDIADTTLLEKIFSEHPDIKCTIHCAALIVVPESVKNPFAYYMENVTKSIILFKKLAELGCKQVVFSSSAAIYDIVPGFMVTEQAPIKPQSPYSRSKFMMEMVLEDFCGAYDMKGIALRYFNPIGADPQMRTGLQIQFPSHVLGKLVEVAGAREKVFKITGTDWPTRDGSGIRDYIHVWDLALAHVKAVDNFERAFDKADPSNGSYLVINIGTGNGVTVKELVSAFEMVYGAQINKELAPPREGDVAGAYANADAAKKLLDWASQLSIEKGIADALKWDEIRSSIIQYQ
ncbi:UDP-glucose 4-epimerase GalE [Vallitalea okinawensis]|uniref:UDP-glucose 4-epimerase GalE n=1 Tax=Vallitalea okinawensis TaxID=2078660 RepID=UPI000CFCEF2B|nr:UDP-glucose 4-epimerase GalE [Vallitalea okinawensis]